VSEQVAAALIGIVPQLLLILIIVVLLIAFRRPLRSQVLPRVSRVSVAGVQVELQPAELRRAFEEQPSPIDRPPPSDASIDAVRARAERNAEAFRACRAIWIDEHPEWTRAERLALHRIGIFVEPVRSVDEARGLIRHGIGGRRADVVISDIASDDGSKHDREVIELVRTAKPPIPLIFYVGRLQPGVPPGVFGITNRPDVLWQLVMDVLERRGP
jgi:hypothetical protein